MAQAYSDSERGGGQGDTGLMRAKILNQIRSWAANAQWADPERAERIFDKMEEAPELFITPNPGSCGTYREEASRCYSEIKDEYGLRLESELLDEQRELEARADRRLREEVREQIETFGAGNVRAVLRGTPAGAPEECRERVRSVLESEGPDVYTTQLPERDASEPTADDSPAPAEPEPVEPAAPEPAPDLPEPATVPERLGYMAAGRSRADVAAEIGQRVGSSIVGALRTTGRIGAAFARGAFQGARSA